MSTTSTCTFSEGLCRRRQRRLLVLEFRVPGPRDPHIDLQSWRGTFVGEDDGTLTGAHPAVSFQLADVMGIVTSLGGCGDERIRQALGPSSQASQISSQTGPARCQGINAALRVESCAVFLFED
ncbi:MAG: hypothetical protein H6674_11240 [Dehalococcoidia bacterium]|nr:hypothetical protein [Dehalococcoidia bacterium]